ncbi:MAG: lysophospholipase [Sphaerochaetaceae bacterium]|nr:lysophospholipase [Sphaerochaetaceae bacterium]
MADKIFICSDGHRLAYNLWMPSPNTEIKAFVQILHGMAEHSNRYQKFAEYLNKNGYAVFAADHRGHGATASEDELGWFAENDGWDRIATDAFELANFITSQYRAHTTFLMGHSMGSFLARTVMVKHPDFYCGVIIMGTGCDKGLIGKLGKMIAKREIRKNGSKAGGVLLNKLCFSSYNKAFEPVATDFDWLSRDVSEVDKYIKDDKCGFLCTNGFFYDLLTGIEYANDRDKIASLPKDLPLLIISGDMDPVGDMGKGVKKVYDLYTSAGIADVTLKLIPGARHELLNEVDRKSTYDILSDWLDSHLY